MNDMKKQHSEMNKSNRRYEILFRNLEKEYQLAIKKQNKSK